MLLSINIFEELKEESKKNLKINSLNVAVAMAFVLVMMIAVSVMIAL